MISRKPFLPEKEAQAQGEYIVVLCQWDIALAEVHLLGKHIPKVSLLSIYYNATSPAKETVQKRDAHNQVNDQNQKVSEARRVKSSLAQKVFS